MAAADCNIQPTITAPLQPLSLLPPVSVKGLKDIQITARIHSAPPDWPVHHTLLHTNAHQAAGRTREGNATAAIRVETIGEAQIAHIRWYI